MFPYSTFVPTPGSVRRASRASRYGTLRRPSSHWMPWVSKICFALCCRNRALYPKPRSLRHASLLSTNYSVRAEKTKQKNNTIICGQFPKPTQLSTKTLSLLFSCDKTKSPLYQNNLTQTTKHQQAMVVKTFQSVLQHA